MRSGASQVTPNAAGIVASNVKPDRVVAAAAAVAAVVVAAAEEAEAEAGAHNGKASTPSVPIVESRPLSPSSRLKIDRFTAGTATAR
jgi:hypothetical protein